MQAGRQRRKPGEQNLGVVRLGRGHASQRESGYVEFMIGTQHEDHPHAFPVAASELPGVRILSVNQFGAGRASECTACEHANE